MNSKTGEQRGNHDGSNVSIVDYASCYGDAFKRLNVEWLEKYFRVEAIDHEVLSAPEKLIIRPGGAILYSLLENEVVGTVALKYSGAGVYELTKMAVTEGCQGLGLGRRLMCAAIARFHDLGGKKLYLESHSSLKPALTLYESAGFRHEPRPEASDYERADVYMVLRPE